MKNKQIKPKRLYDDRRKKRPLFCQIITWRGVFIGAKHFYAKVYEDDNPILKKGSLIYSPNDKECKGKCFDNIPHISFNTYQAALDWIVFIIKEHFPSTTHKLFQCNGLLTLKELKKAIAEYEK